MQAIEEIILGNSLVIKEMKKLIEMVSVSNTTCLMFAVMPRYPNLSREAKFDARPFRMRNLTELVRQSLD